MPKKMDESQLQNYVDSVENGKNVIQATTYDLPIADENNEEPLQETPQTPEERLRAQAPKKKSLTEAQEERKTEVLNTIHMNGMGYLPISLEDLPTRGKFYPNGMKLFIRAATGGEIRHWSQSNEEELLDIDDSLNYILERCLSVKVEGRIADYKDLCEIDRFYLILAIRDFTFIDGNNELMIKITENEELPLHKDNVEFVKFEDNIMRFYNPEKKCFTIQNFSTKKGQKINLQKPLNIYLPKVGITRWLKDYVRRKKSAQEMFDQDFITMAPILIPDYRGLNDEKYSQFVEASNYFGVYEYSIIEQFKRVIKASVSPKFKYVDKEGHEQIAPLTFQGGIKALFLWSGMGDII